MNPTDTADFLLGCADGSFADGWTVRMTGHQMIAVQDALRGAALDSEGLIALAQSEYDKPANRRRHFERRSFVVGFIDGYLAPRPSPQPETP